MPPPDVTDAAAPVERVPPPADRLPTLTEVVLVGGELVRAPPLGPAAPTWPVPAPLGDDALGHPTLVLDHGLSAESLLASALPDGSAVDAHALVQRVLAELGPRVDTLLEARLREALAPALARAADGLIRQARDELSLALRDLVVDAVDRTLRQAPPD
jgi:hypothetical protein